MQLALVAVHLALQRRIDGPLLLDAILAAEAFINDLGGNTGVTRGLTGEAQADNETEWYGRVYAAYYATPNLSIGAFAELWRETADDNGYSADQLPNRT